MSDTMNYSYTRLHNVGLFSIEGELKADHEHELNLMLMRAVHNSVRSVISLKNVTNMERICFALFRKAYMASLRVGNPLIVTEIPKEYVKDLTFSHMQYSSADEYMEHTL